MSAFHDHTPLFGAAPPPVARQRGRARGWFRDPALWAWVVVVLLALLPLRHAFAQLPAMPADPGPVQPAAAIVAAHALPSAAAATSGN